MVRFGFDAVFVQALGDAFRCLAALAINDAAFAGARTEKLIELLVGFGLGQDTISQIRPIEARDVTARVPQVKLLDDV